MNSLRFSVRYGPVLVFTVALWLGSLGNLVAQVRYQVTDLGSLAGPGGFSFATGLNDLGQVIGFSSVSNSSNTHAFLWENGAMTDLGPLETQVTPAGINDLGQVVLNLPSSNFTLQPAVWYRGTLTPLSVPGYNYIGASGINNLGQIAGSISSTITAPGSGVIWFFPLPASHFPLSLTQLGPSTLGGVGTDAGAISDNGHIVGSADLAAVDPATGYPIFHAVSWTNGKMTDLGTLGGNSSIAFGVNNANQITGWSETASLDPTYGEPLVHSFIVQNGVMVDLGTTDSNLPLNFLASSINRQGQIVGDIDVQFTTSPYTYEETGAFIWQNGAMTELGTLLVPTATYPFPSLISAAAINSRGQIAVSGNISPGQIHALLLTPVTGTAAAAKETAQSTPIPESPQLTHRLVRKLTPEGRTLIVVK